MAPTLSFYVLLVLAVSARVSLGNNVDCENLNEGSCAYAVSSQGKRCVLEKRMIGNGLTCRTSDIVAGKLKDYIETEECISACGVDSRALGISSDSLMDRAFAHSLCSEECYTNCPNIIDLYFNLAAGEGVYLPKFCEARKSNGGRREMVEFNSVGSVTAEQPVAADMLDEEGPAEAPVEADMFAGSKDAGVLLQTPAESPYYF